MISQIDLLAVPIVDKNGNATAYFEDAWYNLISAIGGENNTPIADIINITNVNNSSVVESSINDTYTHSISADYTTIGNELIQVTTSCSITLNLTPAFDEKVSVQPTGNYTVNVIGFVNGESSMIIHHAYDLVTFVYTEFGWLIK